VTRHRWSAPVALAVLAVAAAGCGSGGTSDAGQSPAADAVAGAHARVGDLTVDGAYIPAPPPGGMAAAYFTITDTGAPDRLVAVRAPDFRSVSLEKYDKAGDGAESMVGIHKPVTITATTRLVLQPGGDHVMLMNATRALHRGDRVVLRLTFAHAGSVTLQVPVVADTGPSMGGNMSGMPMPSGSSSGGMAGMPGM